MIVTRVNFEQVLSRLMQHTRIGLDTETTGLRPYHGDRLFSIILSVSTPLGDVDSFYFNFQPYENQPVDALLTRSHLVQLRVLFDDPQKIWAIHHATFDMHILWQEGIELAGTVHCTQSIARVEYNKHWEYNLDACGERIGHRKDSTVEDYIYDNKLYDQIRIPGRKATKDDLHYDRVPFDLIVPYGLQDGQVGYRLLEHQEKTLLEQSAQMPPGKPTPWDIVENERRLTKTIFRMERRGLRVDLPYVARALAYETDRLQKFLGEFKRSTGREYMQSGKLFSEVFASDKERWQYGKPTKKTGAVNPSFESEIIEDFENPAAKTVVSIREAQSKVNFYSGFQWFADRNGILHPHLNQAGTDTGRFSSSEPNLQNLTSEYVMTCRACQEGFETRVVACPCGSVDFEEPEFLTRRSFIPRDGFLFIMPDYDQMEYRLMFDTACKLMGRITPLVREILSGKDPHQATADNVTQQGFPLVRKRAKNGNFALLYGSGDATLAKTIGTTVAEAARLRDAILSAAPEVADYIAKVKTTSRTRGYIYNWMGRRLQCDDPNFAYKMPNHHIQGGTADVNKKALNLIDEYLLDKLSKLVLTIHDEDPIEVHESEVHTVPRKVKELMESVYPYTYLPLTVGMEYSTKSLADKVKGFPA